MYPFDLKTKSYASRFSLLALLSFVLLGCLDDASITEPLYDDDLEEVLFPGLLGTEGNINSYLLSRSSLDEDVVVKLENAINLLTTDKSFQATGAPVWGATIFIGGDAIVPTLRNGMSFSSDFFFIKQNGSGYDEALHVDVLDLHNAIPLINALTQPLLTSSPVSGNMGSVEIINVDVRDTIIQASKICTYVVTRTMECISVSSQDVTLCCKCDVGESSGYICSEVSDSGGSGGGGGGGGGGSGGVNPNGTGGNANWTRWMVYLATTPDEINVEVDCSVDPCLCDVINEFVESNGLQSDHLSNEVSALIYKIFGEFNHIDLDITTDNVAGATLSSNVIAETSYARVLIGGGDSPRQAFRATITFNTKDYSTTCSKVHMASTLIHEAMHAYVDYQRSFLTPERFVELYPIYSSDFDESNADHVLIVDHFIDEMVSSLRLMYPNISLEVARALTWGGLEGTSAYSGLSEAEKRFTESINDIALCREDRNAAGAGEDAVPYISTSFMLLPCGG